MRKLTAVLVVLILGACRGEPVPRDYQNNPPAMSNPVDKKEEAPDPQASTVPEPSYGAEGTTGPYEPTKPDVDPGKPVGNPTTTAPSTTTPD